MNRIDRALLRLPASKREKLLRVAYYVAARMRKTRRKV